MSFVINADSLEHLKTLEDNKFDSVVTDPPYHLASIVKRFGPGQKAINNRDTKEGRNGPYHNTAKGFMGQTWDGGDIAFNKEANDLASDFIKRKLNYILDKPVNLVT